MFDKDGVLFDFQRSWGGWVDRMIRHFAAGDAGIRTHLADVLGYDLATGKIRRGSFVIAGTAEEVVDAVAAALPGRDRQAIRQVLMDEATNTQLVPAVPLPETFRDLRGRGLRLGVATNDIERAARAHLRMAGIEGDFDFIAGSDSGYGAKPAPGMCDAFARQTGLRPDALVMVGDSTHDIDAGRAAGFTTIGVLTGVATHEDLAPHADVVLSNIAALGPWLDGRGAT
nr:HAD family hydrolase [Hasllibacter sp. MH4015]